jgi:hypothetical protein
MYMIPQVASLFGGGDNIISLIFQIIFTGIFVVFMFYGQRVQMMVMIREVETHLRRLKFMKDDGRKVAIDTINQVGKPEGDPTARVDQFLDYIAITPQGMDPSGIVWKLEHILDVRDDRFKDEVKLMAPAADETQLNNLENTLEAAMALHQIYKIIRHFYLLGKKTLSLYVIMQIQMVLPLIMQQAEAYAQALRAFSVGQPIGDGAGPLVAGKLMQGYETKEIAKDVVVAEVPIEGRTAYVLKAKGPGGNVGKPGEGISQIIKDKKGKIATVIMIDAALKLEGEKPGEIAEGVGAAIGGPGVEAFKIEEAIQEKKIPLNAIIVKQDLGDAVSPMRKEIFDAADPVIDRIKRLILERTKKGDSIIIAGIGNTIGIGQ